MKPLRVLIVEDSRTVRARLVEVLSEDSGFEVVGEVGDGPNAIRLCESMRPDVISLDMVLPGMSGLDVTRHIMSTRATPILVVSASVNRGEAYDTFDALQAGAVDIFEKSRMGPDSGWIAALKSALRLVARIRVVTRPARKGSSESRSFEPLASKPQRVPFDTATNTNRSNEVLALINGGFGPLRVAPNLVVLGASTGGPAAIAQLLTLLPNHFRLPILIVLHLAPLFASTLADWLGGHSSHPVRLATDGEPVPSPGPAAPVILAPPDRHLVVDSGKLRLSNAPERHSCRPSVDVLFESVARELGPQTIAGLLTGMGRDGATGLLALRQARSITFAQDEATSTVFGMPREAIQIGAAQFVLPLDQIAASLASVASAGVERSTV